MAHAPAGLFSLSQISFHLLLLLFFFFCVILSSLFCEWALIFFEMIIFSCSLTLRDERHVDRPLLMACRRCCILLRELFIHGRRRPSIDVRGQTMSQTVRNFWLM